MIEIEPLEWWHARKFGVLRVGEQAAGLTCFVDGRVDVIGGVYADDRGRLILFVNGRLRPIYHRAAVRFIEHLRQAGVPEVFAFADDRRIAKSEYWLERLGFVRLQDGSGEWRLELGERSHPGGGERSESSSPMAASRLDPDGRRREPVGG